MNQIIVVFTFVLNLITIQQLHAQDTLIMDYEDAIVYALGESFTVQQHEKQKESSKHYYYYYKAQFKPRLDMDLRIPVWNEYVNRIDQPDGLPVYNSYGSLEIGGIVSFQYVLPSGGNISLSSNLYRENLNTLLSTREEELYTEQFYSRFWLSFDQPVFTKNRLKENLKEAEYQYEKSLHFFTRSQMDIVYLVTQEFYQLYKATEQVNIAREKLENAMESYRIAVLKSETGRIPKADVLSAEVSVARDQANLLRSKNMLANQEDELKHLVGMELQQPVKIITDLQYVTFVIDDEQAIQQALNNRLEIKEDNLNIQLQQIEIERAKRERELKGSISAYYDLTGISTLGEGSTLALAESSFEDMTERPHNRGVAFTLSFPIYDWGRGRERLKASQLQMDQKKLELDNQKNAIVKEVREVIRTVRESREQIAIHEKNLELARRSYNISRMRFENGDISNQELSIERERLASIQLEYLDAFIMYQLAVNNLKRKTMWDFENDRSYLVVGGR
jgi:outer membrane protein TolC